MENELARLRIRVQFIEDLKQYADEDALLTEALLYSISAINNRCGFKETTDRKYPEKYTENVLRGAIDWLSRLGGSEYTSFSENGVSASYAEVPSWLMEVASYVKPL